MKTDILIIGKGITGLVMSFLLSKKGIAHKLIAREEKLRPLALGETLPPSALPLLNSLGLLEMFEEGAIKRTTGYHSCWGTDGVTDHNFFSNRPFQYGLKLNKEKLTQLLEEQQKAHIVYFKQSISVAIEDEQEVMMNLADILIETYAAESAMLRTEKLVSLRGQEACADYIAMTQVYLATAVDRINAAAKEAIASFTKGDEQKVMLMGLKRFTKMDLVNTKELRRQIADTLIKEGKYAYYFG